MFKELLPYLRQRAVLLTVTHLDEDQLRVNVIPKKLKEGENEALTTPLSITGTAEEVDRDLPSTLVSFVSSHLQLKNSLEKAKAEMDAAAKTAQTEARAKSKIPAKKEPEKAVVAQSVAVKSVEVAKPEPRRTPSLFELPSTADVTLSPSSDMDDEDEILAEMDQQRLSHKRENSREAA